MRLDVSRRTAVDIVPIHRRAELGIADRAICDQFAVGFITVIDLHGAGGEDELRGVHPTVCAFWIARVPIVMGRNIADDADARERSGHFRRISLKQVFGFHRGVGREAHIQQRIIVIVEEVDFHIAIVITARAGHGLVKPVDAEVKHFAEHIKRRVPVICLGFARPPLGESKLGFGL